MTGTLHFPGDVGGDLDRLLTLIETAHEHGDETAIVEQAAKLRAALTPSPCPGDGMQLVPVTPTEAMYLAAFNSDHWGGKEPIRRVVDEIWSAMLRAALTPSATMEGVMRAAAISSSEHRYDASALSGDAGEGE